MKLNNYIILFLLVATSLMLSSCFTNKIKQTQVISILDTTESWNGKSLPKFPVGQPHISILKVVIPPKSKLASHKHLVINAGYVTKGKLTVVTEEGDTLNLKKGDTISEVVDTWHYGSNPTNKTCEIIVFYANVLGMEHTVKKE